MLSNILSGPKNIGFVSTRFAGTDGVSLEAAKWAEVLSEAGHRCFWFAGELDKPAEVSELVPEAHFQTERNQDIMQAYGNISVYPTLFLVDSDGVIRKHYVNYQTYDVLAGDVAALPR